MLSILDHLKQDPILATILPSEYTPDMGERDLYQDLMKSVIGQQLSIQAASTIYGRFLDLFPSGMVEKQALIDMEIVQLRTVGLSRAKSIYVQNVAVAFLTYEFMEVNWQALQDEEVLRLLTQIKGVGPWTAQMALMFTLQRHDVFPVLDQGIYNAMRTLYGLEGSLSEIRKQMKAIALSWSPYRSHACRFLWAWKDGD